MNPIFIKNILIHGLLIPFYLFTAKQVSLIPTDKLDTLLLFVGLIVIALISSNFIYNYKNAETKNAVGWGHFTTFLSMLVIGMLFITLDVLLVIMLGNVWVFRIAIIIFWAAVVTFDFADYNTLKNKPSK